MKFSMIVPVYNVEAYLNRCVDSLINQTYADIEIILIDDASPDGCPKICDDYAKKDARVKVIHQKNGGLSDARNKGVKMAAGDYVWFVDSDDYIELDACERFALYTENGYDILLGGTFDGGVARENGLLCSPVGTAEVMDGSSYLKKGLKEGNLIGVAYAGPYRRKFLLENKLEFPYGLLHEDMEFAPRSYLKAQSVICTQIMFYHYVKREDSITTKRDQSKNAIDIMKICSRNEALFREVQDEELRQLLLGYLLSLALQNICERKVYHYQAYLGKDFFKRNAYTRSNKLKVSLLFISPRLYCCAQKFAYRFKLKKVQMLAQKAVKNL